MIAEPAASPHRDRTERRQGSLVVPLITGAVAGSALTSRWGAVIIVAGAVCGAAVATAATVIAGARQRPGEIPALWSRIVMSGVLAAPAGWLLGLTGASPLVVGLAFGAVVGLLGRHCLLSMNHLGFEPRSRERSPAFVSGCQNHSGRPDRSVKEKPCYG